MSLICIIAALSWSSSAPIVTTDTYKIDTDNSGSLVPVEIAAYDSTDLLITWKSQEDQYPMAARGLGIATPDTINSNEVSNLSGVWPAILFDQELGYYPIASWVVPMNNNGVLSAYNNSWGSPMDEGIATYVSVVISGLGNSNLALMVGNNFNSNQMKYKQFPTGSFAQIVNNASPLNVISMPAVIYNGELGIGIAAWEISSPNLGYTYYNKTNNAWTSFALVSGGGGRQSPICYEHGRHHNDGSYDLFR